MFHNVPVSFPQDITPLSLTQVYTLVVCYVNKHRVKCSQAAMLINRTHTHINMPALREAEGYWEAALLARLERERLIMEPY